jgi:hypothetical protein
VFENKVLGRIFEPKRNQIIEGCTKLHKQNLHNLYSLTNIIRMVKTMRRWTENVAHMGEDCIQGFDEKARRKGTTRKT